MKNATLLSLLCIAVLPTTSIVLNGMGVAPAASVQEQAAQESLFVPLEDESNKQTDLTDAALSAGDEDQEWQEEVDIPEEEEEPEEETPPAKAVNKWSELREFDFGGLEAVPLPVKPGQTKEIEVVLPEITELGIEFGASPKELTFVEETVPAIKPGKEPQGLMIRLPVIGEIRLKPTMINGELGYEAHFPNDSREINAGILVIDSYRLSLTGQTIAFTGSGTLMNKRGQLTLKRITAGRLSVDKQTGREIGEVDEIIASFVYNSNDRPKLTIKNVGTLVLESTDIIFQQNRPVLIVGTAVVFGVRAEIGMALTKRRAHAFINVRSPVKNQAYCQDPKNKNSAYCKNDDLLFKDVIPAIAKANKSLGNSKIKDLILKIYNLVVLPTTAADKAVAAGAKNDKKKKRVRTTQKPMNDQVRGELTGIISLVGTDLATDPRIIQQAVSKNRSDVQRKEKNPLDAEFNMQFDKYGYTGTMSADALYIKHLGKIESPSIVTSVRKSGATGPVEANLSINGDLVIPLERANTLKVAVDIVMMNQGLMLTGTIPQFTYKGIPLKNIELSLDTISKELMLSGTVSFGSLELMVKLGIIEPTVQNCGKEKEMCIKSSKQRCDTTSKITIEGCQDKADDAIAICEKQAEQALARCKKKSPDAITACETQVKEKLDACKKKAEEELSECSKRAQSDTLKKDFVANCEQEAKEKCEKSEALCIKSQETAKKEGKEPQRAVSLSARLKLASDYCFKESNECINREFKACKDTAPDKKAVIATKEKELKDKEALALAAADQQQEQEAKKLWKEYDKLSAEIGSLKQALRDCELKARQTCAKARSTCEQKQAKAKKDSMARADVKAARQELAGDTGKPEDQVPVDTPTLYPFKDIAGQNIGGVPIPSSLKNIKITNLDVGLDVSNDEQGLTSKSLYIRGIVNAFGVSLPGTLKYVSSDEDESGFLLTIPFTNRVSLAQLFPNELKGDPYNKIYIEKPIVSISTVNTRDPETNLQIPRGLVVSGKVPLSGGLDNVGQFLGKQGKLFALTGIFKWESPRASQLKIAISGDPDALTIQEKCKLALKHCTEDAQVICEAGTSKDVKTCVANATAACEKKRESCEKGTNDLVTVDSVAVAIGFEPSLGVQATLALRLPGHRDTPLKATGAVTLGVKSVRISAFMEGTLYNAFGLKGWELSDIAILFGKAYVSPLPTEFGGSGRIKIVGASLASALKLPKPTIPTDTPPTTESDRFGDEEQLTEESKEELQEGVPLVGKTKNAVQASKQAMSDAMGRVNVTMEGTFLADATMTDMGFKFKTTEVITWTDLLLIACQSFFSSVGQNGLASKIKFINTNLLKVSDLQGSYALKDVRVGNSVIPRGIGLGFKVDLFGKSGRFKMQIRDDGFDGLATFEKINTPFFKITGAGEDKILGTEDDAPIMRVAFNLLNQELYIDGVLALIIPQLGSVKSVTRIDVGFDGLQAYLQGKVFGLFEAELQAKIASGAKNVFVKGKLKQDALRMFEKMLKDAAQELDKKATKDIGSAQKEVNKLSASAQDITAANQRAVERAQEEVQRALRDLNAVKEKLDRAVKACGR